MKAKKVAAGIVVLILVIVSVLYGVVECMNSLKIHSCQKQMAKQRAEQAAIEVQDETKTEEQQTE